MTTNSRGEVSQFDFEELANQLLEQGQAASPADLHGCLCGLLAAGASHQAEAGMDGLNQALDLDLHGELAEQVMALYVVTAQALDNDEFDFYPLLLDDEADIASRTAALAGWCRSFLAGYAQVSAAASRPRAALPGDSSEILQDLAAIAEAGGKTHAPVDIQLVKTVAERHGVAFGQAMRALSADPRFEISDSMAVVHTPAEPSATEKP